MVDALRNAGRVLRPRGRIVDLRPANGYKPTIVIRRGPRRVEVGPIVRDHDPDVAAAARAVRQVVRTGEFAVVHAARPRWRATYTGLGDVERSFAESELWHIPAATRARIVREWRPGDVLEIARTLSLTVLHRR
jgi:hypothetical protein